MISISDVARSLGDNPSLTRQALAALESSKAADIEASVFNALQYLEQGQPLLAYLRADRAHRLQPDQAEITFLRGRCLEALGHTDAALASYVQAQRQSPTYLPVLRALLKLRFKDGALPSRAALRLAHGLLQASHRDADRLLAAEIIGKHIQHKVGYCERHGHTIAGWIAVPENEKVVLGLTDGNRVIGALCLDPSETVAHADSPLAIRKFTFDWPQGAKALTVIHQGAALHGCPICPAEKTLNPADSGVSAEDAESCIDIIIPVYRDFALTQACIASVLANPAKVRYEIVVIDDATPEPGLARWLDELAEQKLITLLRNPVNQGFILAVNRALSVHRDRDVVLLNADTQVTGDWLDRLHAAAYREERIASVTPLSNNGEHFGFPTPFEVSPMPVGTRLARLHQAANRANEAQSIAVPFGIGFCLYLRRACLDQIGYLDAADLKRGYGEEVDLCLRASDAGWEHRCALDVFVAHKGNVSFGEEKAQLVANNNRLIRNRHPEARQIYRNFITRDPIQPYRQAIEHQLLTDETTSHTLVILDAQAHDGLAWKAVWAEYLKQTEPSLILQPYTHRRGNYRLFSCRPEGPQNLLYDLPKEFDSLLADLARLKVRHIDYHDIASQHHEIFSIPRHLGVSYDLIPRDYSGCGAPRYPTEPIESCSTEETMRQTATSAFVGNCRQIRLASARAATPFARQFPRSKVVVTANPRQASNPTIRRQPGQELSIAVIGPLLAHHGYARLLRLARQCAAQNDLIRFHVLGESLNDAPLLATGKVWVSGPLTSEDRPDELARIAECSLALYAPLWTETDNRLFSGTLALGLPTLYWPRQPEDVVAPDAALHVLPYALTPETLRQHAGQLLAVH